MVELDVPHTTMLCCYDTFIVFFGPWQPRLLHFHCMGKSSVNVLPIASFTFHTRENLIWVLSYEKVGKQHNFHFLVNHLIMAFYTTSTLSKIALIMNEMLNISGSRFGARAH